MKYCPNCGKKVEKDQDVCLGCGRNLNKEEKKEVKPAEGKSKIAAGIIGIFFGGLGIHNFYLGYTGKAIAQLLLTLVGWIFFFIGPIVAAIWGFIEAIMILAGAINKDANGKKLID